MNSPANILLIEDDEHDQFFFREAINLVHSGDVITIAKNGKEALMRIDTSEALPDIIFSDINMPVMDGIECLTEIKNMTRTKNIPVIMLSSDTRHIATVRSLGANGFIEKSHNVPELKAKLKKVLNTYFDNHSKMANEIFLIL